MIGHGYCRALPRDSTASDVEVVLVDVAPQPSQQDMPVPVPGRSVDQVGPRPPQNPALLTHQLPPLKPFAGEAQGKGEEIEAWLEQFDMLASGQGGELSHPPQWSSLRVLPNVHPPAKDQF